MCSFEIQGPTLVKAHFEPEGLDADGLTIEGAEFQAHWHESAVGGWLQLAGAAERGGVLVVRLAPIGSRSSASVAPGKSRAFRVKVSAGSFVRKLRLPPDLLPGRYVLRVSNGRGGWERGIVTLAAPPEGVVAKAFASASEREIRVRFTFAARPKLGLPVTISWLGPDGKPFGLPVEKAGTALVAAFVRAPSSLPKGTWRAVLKAGGKVVKTVSAQVA